MKKIFFLEATFLIIILAFGLRLYRINNPLADWHSWRQADTSAVSRNFVKLGFDLFHPRFDDLSNVASDLENPEGYRFVEFPFYNLLQAGFYKFLPFFSLEVWGRLVSIICSLGSLVFLFLITEKYLRAPTALLAAFFFAILPYNIYYSRTILPEPMMVLTMLGMIYFAIRVLENYELRIPKESREAGIANLVLSMGFASLSFLIKPYTLVLLLPIFYLAWQKWHLEVSRWKALLLCCLVALLPFLWWRWWMGQYPEGIPTYGWLFNEAGIRFKGAWFYWLFAERLGKLILGYWGVALFVLGLAIKPTKKEGLFFYSWLVAILVYFAIIAGGNVKHDYYQVIAVPIICVFLAKGTHFLLTVQRKFFSRVTCYLLLVTCILFMLAFSWYQVRDFFNINNMAIVEAGKAADRLLPKEAKVIAPYGGDTAFLYQTKRQGWPVGIEIEKFINLGAEYYVNVNIDDPEVRWLTEKYCLIQKTPQWVIVDLKRSCPISE